MTLSILALNTSSGEIGCAAATGNLAVGAWVLRSAVSVGAVATQGYSVSPLWGDKAMALLAKGVEAHAIVQQLTGEDAGREYRQLAVLDAEGGVAAWSGSNNTDFKGHLLGEGYVIAGNWLSGADVLESMKEKYESTIDSQDSFAIRLIDVIKSAIAAGGDSRGTLSAALRVVQRSAPPLDLRVDYDPSPVEKLSSLLERATSSPYADWISNVPTVSDPFIY